MRWCSATSSAEANSSPSAQRWTSAASWPPTFDQPATLACFTATSTIPSLDPADEAKFQSAANIEGAVKRSVFVLTFLTLVGVGAAVAYQAAAHQRQY